MAPDAGVEIFEIFIKQVFRSDRNKAVSFGQTIADVGIDEPELVLTGLKDSNGHLSLETAAQGRTTIVDTGAFPVSSTAD